MVKKIIVSKRIATIYLHSMTDHVMFNQEEEMLIAVTNFTHSTGLNHIQEAFFKATKLLGFALKERNESSSLIRIRIITDRMVIISRNVNLTNPIQNYLDLYSYVKLLTSEIRDYEKIRATQISVGAGRLEACISQEHKKSTLEDVIQRIKNKFGDKIISVGFQTQKA